MVQGENGQPSKSACRIVKVIQALADTTGEERAIWQGPQMPKTLFSLQSYIRNFSELYEKY